MFLGEAPYSLGALLIGAREPTREILALCR
jgi:hypothetical protein